MSKKKKHESKGEAQAENAGESQTTESTAAPESAPVEAAPESASTEPANGTAPVRASVAHELPPVGTVVQKKDRAGNVLGEITIAEQGKVVYNGTTYNSLSAAALAHSKDRGLKTKAIDGWTWWGLKQRSAKAGERAPRPSNLPARREKLMEQRKKLTDRLAAIDSEIQDVDAKIATEQVKAAEAQPTAQA